MVAVASFINAVASPVRRSELEQNALAEFQIPLTSLRVHDAMQTLLPGTAANDDMAMITGTPGTDAPTLQGVDFGGTTSDEKGAFEFILPPEYDSGESIVVRVRGGMLTTIADDDCEVDVNVWKADENGGVGSDLCATSEQSINNLTPANKDFAVTSTGLVAGNRLIVRVSFIGNDAGNAGVMIPEIQKISMMLDIRG